MDDADRFAAEVAAEKEKVAERRARLGTYQAVVQFLQENVHPDDWPVVRANLEAVVGSVGEEISREIKYPRRLVKAMSSPFPEAHLQRVGEARQAIGNAVSRFYADPA